MRDLASIKMQLIFTLILLDIISGAPESEFLFISNPSDVFFAIQNLEIKKSDNRVLDWRT